MRRSSQHQWFLQQEKAVADSQPINPIRAIPSDTLASSETTALLEALLAMQDEPSFLFGHQYDNYIGQYFKDKEGTLGLSDVQNGTGSYPAVFGYDFLDILESGLNFTEHVKFAYKQGGIITFDWKAYNPEMMGSSGANDVSGTPCAKILKGSGKPYDRYTGWLDTIAQHIETYKVDGVAIPIIFRLLHENTGGWYWWGTGTSDSVDTCPDADYKALFNFTRSYLHNDHGLHNILWLYAPAKPSEYYASSFHERYPGHDQVDIIGMDRYTDASDYKDTILDDCRVVANYSVTHGKVAVIAETGISDGMQDTSSDYKDWYYTDFGKNFMTDSQDLCTKISYAVAWENVHPDYWWVPLPNDATWDGMKKLYESDYAIFADDSTWTSYAKSYGYSQ